MSFTRSPNVAVPFKNILYLHIFEPPLTHTKKNKTKLKGLEDITHFIFFLPSFFHYTPFSSLFSHLLPPLSCLLTYCLKRYALSEELPPSSFSFTTKSFLK